MSEQRFSVDDILREVEQMRSNSSKTPAERIETVSSDTKPEPQPIVKKSKLKKLTVQQRC